MFRVLKVGGRCVISDIVCDEDVPEDLQKDPQLWSGCISGAFREDLLLKLFEDAGFYGIQMIERTNGPWQTIRGIEFRSVTVQAFKGKQGPCFERNQAVIYHYSATSFVVPIVASIASPRCCGPGGIG